LDGFHDAYIHTKGHAMIGSLKVACLLENGEDETQVKTYDVVQSFALWIASSGIDRNEMFLRWISNRLTKPLRIEE